MRYLLLAEEFDGLDDGERLSRIGDGCGRLKNVLCLNRVIGHLGPGYPPGVTEGSFVRKVSGLSPSAQREPLTLSMTDRLQERIQKWHDVTMVS